MAWKDLWSGEWDRQMGRRLHQSDIILLKKVFTEAEGLATCQEEARRVCEHRSAGVRAHGSKAERTGQKLGQSGVCSAFPGADWEPWKNSKQIVKTSETLLWH